MIPVYKGQDKDEIASPRPLQLVSELADSLFVRRHGADECELSKDSLRLVKIQGGFFCPSSSLPYLGDSRSWEFLKLTLKVYMQFPEPIGGTDWWQGLGGGGGGIFSLSPVPAKLHICVLLRPLKLGSALLWTVMATQFGANHQFIKS